MIVTCCLRPSHTRTVPCWWSGLLLDHSLVYALARGLPGVVNFLAIAVYTRLLQPGPYGEYSLAIAAIALLDAVLIQWLRLGLLRFLPQAQESAASLLGVIRSVWLLVAAAVTALTLLAVAIPAVPLPAGLLLGGLLLFLTQGWFELNLELVRSRLQPGRYGRLAMLRAVLSLGLGALLAWLWAAPGLLIGLALGIAASYLILREGSDWQPDRLKLDPLTLRRLTSYGLPLTITFALGFIVTSSDRFLLGWYLDTDATGLYAAGYDLANFSVTMLLTIVNLAAYPLTVQALEHSGAVAARKQLSDTLLLLLAVGLPAGAGLMILAGPIAQVVVGADFTAAAAHIIPWIALAALLAGVKAYFVDVGFQLGGDTRLQAWVMLIAAGLNIALNVLLIPRFGIPGAVYSTVAVYVIALLLSVLLVRRSFALPRLHLELLWPAVATGCMAGLLWLLPTPTGLLSLLGTVLAAAVLYGLVLALLLPRLRALLLRRLRIL